jgi:acrylyl-CoA reductase (NADPH)
VDRFKAWIIDKSDVGQTVTWGTLGTTDLMPGDVRIRVSHTTINYKDGLAMTGKAPVVRRFPMVPGIDCAGTVIASEYGLLQPGDNVILNGWGTGETHLGSYAEIAQVKGGWLVKRPDAFTAAQAMAIGTAGYTAMLCVLALERQGVAPAHGPVLVTGAAGGVGSVAIALLSSLGYRVIASTGRRDEEAYLKALGAADVIDRGELSGPAKPLAKERWAAAVDSVGSTTLANVIASTRYGGAVAACGLAQGMDLPGSVAPFILRGVTLVGVDSVMCPRPLREQAWARLARDLPLAKLDAMTVTRPLSDALTLAPEILAGKIRGRVVLTV